MTFLALEVVIARLEERVMPFLLTGMTPKDKYDVYERVAIQILDSEYMNYPEGALEELLLSYLATLPK
ncbi:MAG: hypothetical protein R3332_05985 [Pseudohongiellaceae bacterium]|nr:hypothetical protein [Pseudohongiellaceae bacterium]